MKAMAPKPHILDCGKCWKRLPPCDDEHLSGHYHPDYGLICDSCKRKETNKQAIHCRVYETAA